MRTKRWALRALVAIGVTLLVADGGLRQDEIDCEQAVSYLQGCCPDSAIANVQCVYDVGCGIHVEPDLSIAESQCIVGTSCEQIVANGICTRVRGLPGPTENDAGVQITPSHGSVCP